MWVIHCDKCGTKLKIETEQIGGFTVCHCGREVQIWPGDVINDQEGDENIKFLGEVRKPTPFTKPLIIALLVAIVMIGSILAYISLTKEDSKDSTPHKMSDQEVEEFVRLLEDADKDIINKDVESARKKIEQAKAMLSVNDEAKYKGLLAETEKLLNPPKSPTIKKPVAKERPQPTTQQNFLGLTYEQWSAHTMMKILEGSSYTGKVVRYEFFQCPQDFRIFVRGLNRDEAKKLAARVAMSFNDNFPLDICMVSVWMKSTRSDKFSVLAKVRSR